MRARGHLRILLCALAALVLTAPAALAQTGTITTVAGGGPNNVAKLSASFQYPVGVAQDSNGNTYVVDADGQRVFKINSSGTLTVFAGMGTSGYSGDGGPATSAELRNPSALAVDSSGNVYIADASNSLIRKVDTTGTITTVAGNYNETLCGNPTDAIGDGCPATSATLFEPSGLAIDASGNLVISDTVDYVVREVYCINPSIPCTPPAGATAGNIYTIAGMPNSYGFSGDGGPATSAQLAYPIGVSVDASGNIFVADFSNEVIREVVAATGNIRTVAGTPQQTGYGGDNGPATSALLNSPKAVFVDATGNVFITDSYNSIIRQFTVGGSIQTIVGNPQTQGYTGDGGAATSAQIAYPAGVYLDSSGDIFISDSNNYVVREVYCADAAIPCTPPNGFVANEIVTFAGNGASDFGGDGSPATDAVLNYPGAVATGAGGDFYIADTYNQAIRQVSGATGNISTIAGMPAMGESCDPSPTSVMFCYPSGVLVDGAGNVFIADTSNQLVYEIPAGSGQIQLIAGLSGDVGTCNDTQLGDGCPGTEAALYNPTGLAEDASGNLYIADAGDSVIRVVYCATSAAGCTAPAGFQAGYINTVAGTPQSGGFGGDGGPATSANLNGPYGVTVDQFGNIFIADSYNAVIREVYCANSALTCTPPVGFTAGSITTIAGTPDEYGYSGDGGPALSAFTSGPYDVKVDPAGNVFFSDCGLDDEGCNNVIRVVYCATAAVACTPPAGFQAGYINTVAGNGTEGFSGDGGAATSAELDYPGGISIDASGNLLIADQDNSRIRSVAGIAAGTGSPGFMAMPNPLAFGNQPEGVASTPMTLTFSNPGTAALTITGGLTPTGGNAGDFAQVAGAGTCGGLPITIAASSSCSVQYVFTPTATPVGNETTTLMVADNATGSPQTVTLNGSGILPTVTYTPAATVGINFGAVVPGMTSGVFMETVAVAAGTGDLQISFIQTISPDDSNDFAINFQATTCPTDGGTIKAGTSCVVAMTFTPSTATTESGSLEIVGNNLTGSPVEIPLTGIGASTAPGFTLTVTSPNGGNGSTVSILPGDTATFTLTIQPNPGFIGPITVMCNEVGSIPATILTTSPTATINVTTSPSGPITVTCTLQTNCNPSLVAPRAPWPAPGPWTPAPLGAATGLALMLAMLCRKTAGGAGWAQRLAPVAAACVLVLLLITFAACVNNPAPIIKGAPTTPAGVYQIQVVATAPGIPPQAVPLTVHII